MSTIFAIHMAGFFLTPVDIAMAAFDLARGRMRDLPSAPLFITVQVIILVAYLALGVMLLVPLLLLGLAHLLGALLVAYLVLGTAQATAIAAGLEVRGNVWWRVYLGALLLAYLPVVGSAVAVWGAAVGWGWSIGTGLVRFFGPFAAIVGPVLALLVLFLAPRT